MSAPDQILHDQWEREIKSQMDVSSGEICVACRTNKGLVATHTGSVCGSCVEESALINVVQARWGEIF